MTREKNMTMTIDQTIDKKLSHANGRRRERLLSKREVAQVLSEAISELGYGYTTGGHVAGGYKYRAYTTAAFALANGPDYIALRIAVADGGKNASPVTWAGPRSEREKDIKAFCDRQTLYTLVVGGWMLMTRKEAKRFIRAVQGIAVPKNLPAVTVTLADSLAAGNCRMTSERVAAWFAAPAIQSATLVRRVREREPILLPFALRAIAAAAKRVSA
jgi:hypothetical protein